MKREKRRRAEKLRRGAGTPRRAVLLGRVKFRNGKVWRLFVGGTPSKWWGSTYVGKRVICIQKTWSAARFYELVDTIVHEAIHAAFPFLDENAVLYGANDITRVLSVYLKYYTERFTEQAEYPFHPRGPGTPRNPGPARSRIPGLTLRHRPNPKIVRESRLPGGAS